MPTYEYRCRSCDHQFEEFHSITAPPRRKCPACGKNQLERLIGSGAGVIFKGGGFYQTDYRSDSYKKAAEADKKSTSPDTGSPAATDKSSAETKAQPSTDTSAASAPKPPKKKRKASSE
jgi:putative FmdB family regulatory protein